MSQLSLSLAFSDNPRVRPLLTGTVKIEGVRLVPSVLPPGETFWRQLHREEFDISEMSLSSMCTAHQHGDSTWVVLPIFPARHFFHTWILINAAAGIEAPADLSGRRVGIPEYSMSAGVWSRGILADQFGVAASDMRWFVGRAGQSTLGSATGVSIPQGIDVSPCPPGDDLASMLAEGRIDALMANLGTSAIDASGVDLTRDRRVGPLFDDAVAEGTRYFKATGIYPMNHAVVVRRELVERHPWLPVNIFEAFLRAKRAAWQSMHEAAEHYIDAGAIVVGPDDVIPYGVDANQATLDAFLRYAHDSGVTQRVLRPSDVFDPSTATLGNGAYGDPLPADMR